MGCSHMTLLDTHALLWLVSGDTTLGNLAKDKCNSELQVESLTISAISWWEIEMLAVKGRISLSQSTDSLRDHLANAGLVEIPVDGKIGISAAALPNFHGDPADRIITATALAKGALLITADRKILTWEGACQCHDARQ